MGLLKAFDQIVWGLIVFVVIALIVVCIYLPYIVGALAAIFAINYFVMRHRQRRRERVVTSAPRELPEAGRTGKFTFRKNATSRPRSYKPLPLDIVLPDGTEIREIK